MVLGALSIMMTAVKLQQIDHQSRASGQYLLTSDDEALLKREKIGCYIAIALFAAWVISAMFVIFGVKIEIRGFLIPWLIITVFMVGLMILIIIYFLVHAKATFAYAITICSFIIFLLSTGVILYGVICVACFFRAHLSTDYYY